MFDEGAGDVRVGDEVEIDQGFAEKLSGDTLAFEHVGDLIFLEETLFDKNLPEPLPAELGNLNHILTPESPRVRCCNEMTICLLGTTFSALPDEPGEGRDRRE